MIKRGAQSFIFLSRSAAQRHRDIIFIDFLKSMGASVTVHCGDISIPSDVERAIAQITLPIGGVVHAAMGLSVS